MMFRPLPVLTAATLIALAILVGLGIWQLQRRAEKHALLDQIDLARERAARRRSKSSCATGDYAALPPRDRATARSITRRKSYVYAPRTERRRRTRRASR